MAKSSRCARNRSWSPRFQAPVSVIYETLKQCRQSSRSRVVSAADKMVQRPSMVKPNDGVAPPSRSAIERRDADFYDEHAGAQLHAHFVRALGQASARSIKHKLLFRVSCEGRYVAVLAVVTHRQARCREPYEFYMACLTYRCFRY